LPSRESERAHFNRDKNSTPLNSPSWRLSLNAGGLLQPTYAGVVKGFGIIVGDRRQRAASNLGGTGISAIVGDFDDRTSFALTIVEKSSDVPIYPR